METTIKKTKIRDLSLEERRKYVRENRKHNRLKQKKCSRHNAQATVRNLFTQELLCDTCDKERLLNKYRRKEQS